MFRAIVDMKNISESEKLIEVFRAFLEKTTEMRNAGIDVRVLETGCFLIYESAGEKQHMDIHQAKSFAYKIGLLAGDGELQSLVKEPPQEVIVTSFAKATIKNLNSQLVNRIFDYMVGPI